MNSAIRLNENNEPQQVAAQIILSDEYVQYSVADVLKLTYENVRAEVAAKCMENGLQASLPRITLRFEVEATR